MKICIIGAGFYGSFLAYKLCDNHKIHIYEKSSNICTKAATNNQNRLHLGYHYPRSIETIDQIIQNYNDFHEEFEDCISTYQNSIYAIHQKSKIDFIKYVEIFDNYRNLNHSIVDKYNDIWYNVKNPNQFEGALATHEGVIDTKKMRLKILNKIIHNNNIKVFCNYNVEEEDIYNLSKKYDCVINCTYNIPDMGLFSYPEIKQEQCIILKINSKRYLNLPFTIMDGPFCSIVPIDNKSSSLSSVRFTPFSKGKVESFDVKKVIDDILLHSQQYFYVQRQDIVDYYYSLKTKIKHDHDDQREAFVVREGNIFSVFSGKISCGFQILKDLEHAL